jgi:hypothetical protein
VRLRAALLALALPATAGAQEALRAARPAAPPLELRAARTEAGYRILVRDPKGGVRQTIEVESDAPSGLHLADIDGDGAVDLWVPVMAGNANTAYGIWRMLPTEGRFRQVGEVSGFSFRRDAGFLVAVGRNGCCALSYEFHRLAGDALVLAFTIGSRFREDGRVEACEATPARETPPAELRRRWCAPGVDGPLPGQRL